MGTGAKILLVDDDVDFVEATRIVLESKAYRVVTAYDGQEGLRKLEAEMPDLVVMDVMMPKKHGFDTCKEIKANPKFARIPVILLTAVGQNITHTSYTIEMGLHTQANDYVEKPVEPDELVRRIEDLLSQRGADK